MAAPPRTALRRLRRRVIRVVGWSVGGPLAIFRFFRRQVPIEQERGRPPLLPAHDPDPEHQEEELGVGPVTHACYSATIEAPKLDARRLLAVIAADPNVIAPAEMLRFERTRADPGGLRQGEELLIRMVGPWNAPVEVTRRWETGFRLAAKRGHPQLGQFELSCRDENGDIAIEIRTRERSAGLAFHLLRLVGLILRIQTYAWAEMLENAAQLAGGRPLDRVRLRTWT